MEGNHPRKLIAAFLGVALTLSTQQAAFAAGGIDPAELADQLAGVKQTEQTGEQPAETPVQGSNLLGAPATDPAEGEPQTDPQTEPEPEPAAEHRLTGTVYEYKYESDKESGKAAAKEIKITLADDSEQSVTPTEDGTFSLDLEDTQVKESGEYEWSFEADADYLAASGTIKEGEESSIYIQERYEPKSTDYTFDESDDIINKILRRAGIYTILPAEGKKLASELDGEAKTSLKINVADDGTLDDFYIITEAGDCSKVLSGEKADIDDGSPKIGSVEVTPAAPGTYVKAHGIYAKEKAELLVKVNITEHGVGLEKVYLVGKKGEESTIYYPVSQKMLKGEYTYGIGIPDEETLLDSEVMYVVAEDMFGNKSKETLIAKTEEGSSVTVEAIAPTISKDITPQANDRGWYNELPTIKATANDLHSGLASLTITQDGEDLETKEYEEKTTDEQSISGKAKIDSPSSDGTYSFKITAKDNADNETEDAFKLKIDLEAPVLSISGAESGKCYSAPPEVKVSEDEDYPNAEGNIIKVEVSKKGSDSVQTQEFTEASSGTVSKDFFKEDGEYTVTVNAEDAAGNKAKAASVTFIKDGTKPALKLTNSGKANTHGWYNKVPTITATTKDSLAGLTDLVIRQDGKDVVKRDYKALLNEQQASVQADVSSPTANGAYTFTASAKDRAGNEASQKLTLKIDTVAPVLSTEGVTNGEHYKTIPNITVKEKEKYYGAEGAYIRYHITRDGKVDVSANSFKQTNEGVIPSSAFKTDGDYAVSITAKDAAGNEAEEILLEFTKDSQAPDLKWSGVKDGKFYNKKQTVTLTVKERWYKTDKVDITATRKLGDNTDNVGFPWKNEGETSESSKTFGETGTYTLTAKATDKAGNSSGTKKISFTVDTKAPEIKISGVRDGGIYTYGMGVAPKADVTDDYLDSKSITYTKGGVPIANPSFEQLKENDGLYTMTVTAKDKAGNVTTKTVSFVVNRFGSWFEYNDAIKTVMGNAFQNIDNDLVITERDISKLTDSQNKVYRDGKAVEAAAQTKEDGVEDGYNVYRHVFGKELFQEEGAYEINVVSKDDAGNEMESKDENGKVVFYVDRTEPTITVNGIDPKGIKSDHADLTVTASDLLTGVKAMSATVDGEAATLKENSDGSYTLTLKEGLRQKVHISATDGAGNEAVFDDSASVSSSAVSLFFDRFKLWLGLGAAALAAAAAWFIIAKRRDDDDEEEDEEDEE